MYYILFYETVENYIEKRAPFRSLHFAHIQKYFDAGQIIMGGALDDPADEAVIIFKVDDITTVRNFAETDPYVQNGLISSWRVRPWTVVFGGD